MLKDISIKCSEGKIRIYWEWEDDQTESVSIFYKENFILNGDGTSFSNVVMHYSHQMSGGAERQLTDERGLYTFTFIPKRKDGKDGDKIVLKEIMLGKPVTVYWTIQRLKEGYAIVFPKLSETLMKGSACLQGKEVCFPLDYEIDGNTKLLFGEYEEDMRLEFVFLEPYNKVYRSERRYMV